MPLLSVEKIQWGLKFFVSVQCCMHKTRFIGIPKTLKILKFSLSSNSRNLKICAFKKCWNSKIWGCVTGAISTRKTSIVVRSLRKLSRENQSARGGSEGRPSTKFFSLQEGNWTLFKMDLYAMAFDLSQVKWFCGHHQKRPGMTSRLQDRIVFSFLSIRTPSPCTKFWTLNPCSKTALAVLWIGLIAPLQAGNHQDDCQSTILKRSSKDETSSSEIERWSLFQTRFCWSHTHRAVYANLYHCRYQRLSAVVSDDQSVTKKMVSSFSGLELGSQCESLFSGYWSNATPWFFYLFSHRLPVR